MIFVSDTLVLVVSGVTTTIGTEYASGYGKYKIVMMMMVVGTWWILMAEAWG